MAAFSNKATTPETHCIRTVYKGQTLAAKSASVKSFRRILSISMLFAVLSHASTRRSTAANKKSPEAIASELFRNLFVLAGADYDSGWPTSRTG
jgi:hypothetical protein